MSVYESTIFTKAKGKVGNLVLSNLKGQKIAKSYNPYPSNPQTTAQTSNRAQMSNVVLGYQALAVYFNLCFALRKSTESIYNAIVRIFKNGMATSVVDNAVSAAQQILNQSLWTGGVFTGLTCTPGSGKFTFDWTDCSQSWVSGTKLRMVLINDTAKTLEVLTHVITEAEFTAKTLDVSATIPASCTFGAYIAFPDGKSISYHITGSI